MRLVLALFFSCLIFFLLTYGLTMFNKFMFKTTNGISRKWALVSLVLSYSLFMLITPNTNQLDNEMKKWIIIWAMACSGIYMLANVIREGMSIKYGKLEIETKNVSRETSDEEGE